MATKYVITGEKPDGKRIRVSAIVFPNKKSTEGALKAIREVNGGRYSDIKAETLKQFNDGKDKKD